jgi:hypothetical protein
LCFNSRTLLPSGEALTAIVHVPAAALDWFESAGRETLARLEHSLFPALHDRCLVSASRRAIKTAPRCPQRPTTTGDCAADFVSRADNIHILCSPFQVACRAGRFIAASGLAPTASALVATSQHSNSSVSSFSAAPPSMLRDPSSTSATLPLSQPHPATQFTHQAPPPPVPDEDPSKDELRSLVWARDAPLALCVEVAPYNFTRFATILPEGSKLAGRKRKTPWS